MKRFSKNRFNESAIGPSISYPSSSAQFCLYDEKKLNYVSKMIFVLIQFVFDMGK